MDATAKRVLFASVPALTATVRSRPKRLPQTKLIYRVLVARKHAVVHAQSFSQVPAVFEWTGHVCFARQFAKPAGPLEPVELDDARGPHLRHRPAPPHAPQRHPAPHR